MVTYESGTETEIASLTKLCTGGAQRVRVGCQVERVAGAYGVEENQRQQESGMGDVSHLGR
jgi:hypothetical protein